MAMTRTEKVVCYIVRHGRLLVLVHEGFALEETGVQVPAGTIRRGESPEEAALREGSEETGLTDLRLARRLGEADYDIRPYRPEVMHRHFVELSTGCDTAATWTHQELDPEHGGAGPYFRCSFIPLEQAHVLAGGLGALVRALVDD